jgi:hypothetical protein
MIKPVFFIGSLVRLNSKSQYVKGLGISPQNSIGIITENNVDLDPQMYSVGWWYKVDGDEEWSKMMVSIYEFEGDLELV